MPAGWEHPLLLRRATGCVGWRGAFPDSAPEGARDNTLLCVVWVVVVVCVCDCDCVCEPADSSVLRSIEI